MEPVQQSLFPPPQAPCVVDSDGLRDELLAFSEFGGTTRASQIRVAGLAVPTFLNEFWTSRQRAACRLHEISYRACFKPQLPRFFIERLTRPGDRVHDPFMGRGTTALEAALLGRRPCGCDVNPLSLVLTRPRLFPPEPGQISARLAEIDLTRRVELPPELLVFYHPDTLQQICALRAWLLERADALEGVDEWIRMVAVNRLTGHSPGFFSVYTMPPNQAVSVESQRKINARREQQPTPRNVPDLILRKSRSLLGDCGPARRASLLEAGREACFSTGPAEDFALLEDESVALVVTSPPFLDVVQYAADNWLRCWFCGILAEEVPITMLPRLEDWCQAMTRVFAELSRVLRPGGHIAFEVGEVRRGRIKLEEEVIPCGLAAGLSVELVLINEQEFTKTANCWGVRNNELGTNSNRVVLFRKPP